MKLQNFKRAGFHHNRAKSTLTGGPSPHKDGSTLSLSHNGSAMHLNDTIRGKD